MQVRFPLRGKYSGLLILVPGLGFMVHGSPNHDKTMEIRPPYWHHGQGKWLKTVIKARKSSKSQVFLYLQQCKRRANFSATKLFFQFPQAIKEIRKLRKQLTSEINLSVSGADATIDPEMAPPDDNQARLLRQLILSGLADQVARKIQLNEVKDGKHHDKLSSFTINNHQPSFNTYNRRRDGAT